MLELESQLDIIDQNSFTKPVLIFKHSTRCSISFFAQKTLDGILDSLTEKYELFHLDLLKHRDLSNHIAVRYEVVHESPQVLLIKNADCYKNASHSEITNEFFK